MKCLRNNQGSSLATTLVVIAVLSVFVVGFQFAIYSYGVRTVKLHDESQAYLYARSAALALAEELAEESAAEWEVLEALIEAEERAAEAAEEAGEEYIVNIPDMTPKHPVLKDMYNSLEDYGDSIQYSNASFEGAAFDGDAIDTGSLSIRITYTDVNAYVISATATLDGVEEDISLLLNTSNTTINIPDDVAPPSEEEPEVETGEGYTMKLGSMVGFTAPTIPMVYRLNMYSANRFFSYLPTYLYNVASYNIGSTTVYCPYDMFISGGFNMSQSGSATSNLVSGGAISLYSGTLGKPVLTDTNIYVEKTLTTSGANIDKNLINVFDKFGTTYSLTQPVWVSAVQNVSTYTNAAGVTSWNTSPNGDPITVYAWDGGWNGSTLTVTSSLSTGASEPVYFIIQEGQSVKITGSTGLGCHFYIEEGGELIFTNETVYGYIYAEPVTGTLRTNLYSALLSKVSATGSNGTLSSVVSAYESDMGRVQLSDSCTFYGSISAWFKTNYFNYSSNSGLSMTLNYTAPIDSNYTAFYSEFGSNGTTVTVTDSQASTGDSSSNSGSSGSGSSSTTGRTGEYLVYDIQQFIKGW